MLAVRASDSSPDDARFACTINGFDTSDLKLEADGASTAEHFVDIFSGMDGKSSFSFLLWELPTGKRLENVIRKVALR